MEHSGGDDIPGGADPCEVTLDRIYFLKVESEDSSGRPSPSLTAACSAVPFVYFCLSWKLFLGGLKWSECARHFPRVDSYIL